MLDKLQELFPTHYRKGNILLINTDCMDVMAHLDDNAFDLAIVDPPYGLGNALVAGGTWSKKYQEKGAEWDIVPDKNYFNELFRVSKNYIVWGGNYYNQHLQPSRCFICWIKPNMVGMHTMADGELALTSFDQNAKIISLSSQSNENRIHVCQKPVKLYQWLLTNYAKPEQIILDTHLGSGSSAIAAYYFGATFIGIELDSDYFNASVERFKLQTAQTTIFN